MRKTLKITLAALAAFILIIAANRLASAPAPAFSESGRSKAVTPVVTRLDEAAEELFIEKYLAYVTRQTPLNQPLAMCDACILQCEQADLAGCRKLCRRACGLNERPLLGANQGGSR